jgi:hypothetical protein
VASRLLGLQVWIPPGARMFVLCCVCCTVRRNGKSLDKRSTKREQKKSRRGHRYLSVVSVVCLSGRSLCDGVITRPESPTDCGASLCVISKPQEWGG